MAGTDCGWDLTMSHEEDRQELEFDTSTPAGLTHAMSHLPGILGYWVYQLELLDEQVDQLEAKAFNRETELGTQGGKPPAIERVKAIVPLDPEVHAAKIARAHAKAMVEGLRAKRDMLVATGAMIREEMKAEPRTRE